VAKLHTSSYLKAGPADSQLYQHEIGGHVHFGVHDNLAGHKLQFFWTLILLSEITVFCISIY